MSSKVFSVIFVAAVVASVVPMAQAQSTSGDWQFNIAPYLVAASMDGTVTVKRFEGDVDVPFDELLDQLEMAGMVHFDMKNEHWMLSSDLLYVKAEQTSDVLQGTSVVTVEQTFLEFVGGYRVSPVFTILAGARGVDLGVDQQFTGPHRENSHQTGKSWIDPIVGAHVLAPLAEKWWLGLRGDIGGFGVGSELAWQAYVNVGFRASDLISVILGYRAVDMEYEEGSGSDFFRYDMRIDGPQVGVAFSF